MSCYSIIVSVTIKQRVTQCTHVLWLTCMHETAHTYRCSWTHFGFLLDTIWIGAMMHTEMHIKQHRFKTKCAFFRHMQIPVAHLRQEHALFQHLGCQLLQSWSFVLICITLPVFTDGSSWQLNIYLNVCNCENLASVNEISYQYMHTRTPEPSSVARIQNKSIICISVRVCVMINSPLNFSPHHPSPYPNCTILINILFCYSSDGYSGSLPSTSIAQARSQPFKLRLSLLLMPSMLE